MIEMNQGTITEEVESRLDDIFGDGDTVTGSEENEAGKVEPLRDLKATLLSLDWEITDEGMDRLVEQTGGLKGAYSQDRHVQTCSQLLLSLGKYLKAHKGEAHPDTGRRMNSVFACLEKILQCRDLHEKEKNRLVLNEIQAFKRLKEEIVQRRKGTCKLRRLQVVRAQTSVPPAVTPGQKTVQGRVDPIIEKGGVDGPVPAVQEAVALAMAEVVAIIKEEFEALRTDLKSWIGAMQK